LSAVVRIEASYAGNKWSLSVVPTIGLIVLYDRIAKYFQLIPAEISLSTFHGAIPREYLALGEWLSRFEPTLLLEVEVKMGGILVELEYGNGAKVIVDEKPHTLVQKLYEYVAGWRTTQTTSFYLSFGGRLLPQDDSTTIGALAVDSKVKLAIVEAAQVAKIRITRNGLSDAIFGFPHDTLFETMWAEAESSLPDMVVFPPNCHAISPNTSFTAFSKLWEACKMAEVEFVVDALPKSDTVQVRVQIDANEVVLVSKVGTLVGDIFTKAIATAPILKGVKFAGHDGEDITDTDWVHTQHTQKITAINL
jgi:hypothetical protein